jgi:hypothetical protein
MNPRCYQYIKWQPAPYPTRAVSRIFLLGGGGRGRGEARVIKASTEGAKPRAAVWEAFPENFEKLDALRGVFPPSQKLKDKPTKCTFWVNFVGKTLCSDKQAT